VLRIGLWFRAVDYVIFGSGNSRTLSKLNPQRCTVRQSPGDDTLGSLLEKRLLAHHKSVLWVDPNLTTRNPSMRSLVHSIGALNADGWSVRGLCYEHPQNCPLLEITRLPRLPVPRPLDMLQFFLSCNLVSVHLNQSVSPATGKNCAHHVRLRYSGGNCVGPFLPAALA